MPAVCAYRVTGQPPAPDGVPDALKEYMISSMSRNCSPAGKAVFEHALEMDRSELLKSCTSIRTRFSGARGSHTAARPAQTAGTSSHGGSSIAASDSGDSTTSESSDSGSSSADASSADASSSSSADASSGSSAESVEAAANPLRLALGAGVQGSAGQQHPREQQQVALPSRWPSHSASDGEQALQSAAY